MKPQVTIRQVAPRGPVVTANLGDGYAIPTADGGWSTQTRPKRISFTQFDGYDPVRMPVPLCFDGFADNRSVESEVAAVWGMMRKRQGTYDEPPQITISGPVAFTSYRWVISGFTINDEIRRESDGKRVRVNATLELLQYVEPDVVIHHKSSPAKKSQKRSSGKHKSSGTPRPSSRKYTVKRGDTLGTIAARLLHSASRWHDIAKLNGIRDPNSIRVGQVLRIP